MSVHLFVYGTLRRGFPNPCQRLLDDEGSYLGRARFQGRLFEIDGYPGALASDNPEDQVVGELYRIDHADAVLAALDQYEECTPAFAEPWEYVRREVRVSLPDGTALDAWTYLYNRRIDPQKAIPSGDYLRYDRSRR